MERIIFHVDVNSAFLSWSAVKRLKEDPASVDLRTIPSAVGGDVETRHGIITAKSIPAKKFGVTTGEPVMKALQKCPGLVLISSDWQTYHQYSRAFLSILHEYSDLVEQASVDEAYVDMTEAAGTRRGAEKLAAAIREEVRTNLGFTVNVGISSNKLLAKMASDFQKPDRTHTLWPEEIRSKMWPLPIGSLYGCGSKTAERLAGIGIVTIGDAAAADLSVLRSFLGEKSGEYICRAAHGIGSERVRTQSEEAKSYSNETTTAEDVTVKNYERLALPLIRHLSEKVSLRLQRDKVYGSTVTVNVKTGDFRRHSRQKRLSSSTNDASVIRRSAEELLKGLLYEKNGIFDRGAGVRLIGVGVSTLDHGEYRQMDFDGFLQQQKKEKEQAVLREKKSRLNDMMKAVQTKYGADMIHRGIP